MKKFCLFKKKNPFNEYTRICFSCDFNFPSENEKDMFIYCPYCGKKTFGFDEESFERFDKEYCIEDDLKKDCENCMIIESFCDGFRGILRKIESGRVDEAKKTILDILSEFNYEYAILSDSIDDNEK